MRSHLPAVIAIVTASLAAPLPVLAKTVSLTVDPVPQKISGYPVALGVPFLPGEMDVLNVRVLKNGRIIPSQAEEMVRWGGKNSGIDGGNQGGTGITDVPGGLKLQCEGHEVLFRNAWIKELDIREPNTDWGP